MRLRDLDASFLRGVSDTGSYWDSDSIDGAQGVLFQCPKCGEGKERGFEDGRGHIKGAHYIRVCFANPINAKVAPPEFDKNPRWQMSGTSLDDLTLSPSVNCDVPVKDGAPSSCRFHGWVKDGEVA